MNDDDFAFAQSRRVDGKGDVRRVLVVRHRISDPHLEIARGPVAQFADIIFGAVEVGQQVVNVARDIDDRNGNETVCDTGRDHKVDHRVFADEIATRGVRIGSVAKAEIEGETTCPRGGERGFDQA